MTFIEVLLLNALIIAGFKLATEEGMVLHFISRLRLPQWVAAPLYACSTCMASVWSLPVFAWFYGAENWILYPFYVLALAASSTFVYAAIDKISR